MSGRLCWTDGGVAVKTKGLLTALAFVSLALTACAPGVQPLMDEYNALFDSVTERGKEQVAAGKLDWLQNYYEISYTSGVSLHAPEHCSSYKWELQAHPDFPGSSVPAGFDIEKYSKEGPRHFILEQFKGEGFVSGSCYILTCTVELHGEVFTDRCTILLVD